MTYVQFCPSDLAVAFGSPDWHPLDSAVMPAALWLLESITLSHELAARNANASGENNRALPNATYAAIVRKLDELGLGRLYVSASHRMDAFVTVAINCGDSDLWAWVSIALARQYPESVAESTAIALAEMWRPTRRACGETESPQ